MSETGSLMKIGFEAADLEVRISLGAQRYSIISTLLEQ